MKRHGFSLLELLLVVVILGIIAAIVVPRISTSSDGAKERVCEANCAQINSAIERYGILNGSWPSADLNELDSDVNAFPEGLPTCPVSGNPYTMNTTTYRVQGHDGSHP